MQSRSNPTRVYTLTVEGGIVHCQCAHYQLHGICAHAAAERLALHAQQPPAPAPSALAPARPSARQSPRSREQRRAEERREREEAERRERALLRTDDRPFSMFK